MISLWTATSYLIHKGRNMWGSLLTALPATFMTAVTTTYILMADEGFGLSGSIAYPAGIILAVFAFAVYITQLQQWRMAPEDLKENWTFVAPRRRMEGTNEE